MTKAECNLIPLYTSTYALSPSKPNIPPLPFQCRSADCSQPHSDSFGSFLSHIGLYSTCTFICVLNEDLPPPPTAASCAEAEFMNV
jgi:hypothetical protein